MNNIILPDNYVPSIDEEYMNSNQLEYFKKKLIKWKEELLKESIQTIENLKEENWHEADLNDRASIETEATSTLRTRNRYMKLISKIDQALERIKNKEYGYCEETGEEIGLKRLEARPVAVLTIEAQERHEQHEKSHSED